jgi:hypothetical protein
MAGGRRDGAGREPGSEMVKKVDGRDGSANLISGIHSTNVRSTGLVLDKTIPDDEQSLLGLQPGIQTAIRMFVRNKPKTEIADELGVSRPTIDSYISRFPMAVMEASIEAAVGPDQLLRPLLPKVMGVYNRLLDANDKPEVQGAMARDVMDRTFGKAVVRAQVESVQPVSVEFLDLEATDVTSTNAGGAGPADGGGSGGGADDRSAD